MTPALETLPGVTVLKFGHEGEPVVLIDSYVRDAELLRTHAASQFWQRLGPHYPGVRAPAPATYLNERADLLKRVLIEVFDMTNGAELVESNFSLVTTPPEQLSPIQRLPHFDSLDRGRLALLHYLGGPDQGGTAFYRHRSTGFETLSEERHSPYAQKLQSEVTAAGGVPAGYFCGDSPLFEKIGEIQALPNRMAIYRGVTLHSGVIPDGFPFDPDPRTGRLTINTFLQARPV